MTNDHSAADASKKMNLCYVARKSLSNGKLSQHDFAELQGRSKSVIYRREADDLGISGTPATLYQLIIELARQGMAFEAEQAMRSVPETERTEDKALIALVMLCVTSGKATLVNRLTGQVGPDEGEGDFSMKDQLKVFEIAAQDIERQAKRAPDSIRQRFRAAGSSLNATIYELGQAYKEMRETTSDSPPDEGNST